MVQLSKERILEWQKLFEKEYGKKLSFAEATEAANNLVGFFDLLLKIDMRQNPQNYIKNVNHQRSKEANKR
ncbi:MAG: hypothetical protein ABIG40_00880 [Parcubacteria group bacterium]